MRFFRCFAVAVLLTGALGAPARAQTTLAPEAGWQGFSFEGVGTSVGFFLNAIDPIRLRITDAYLSGDAFDVFINGVLGFSTPSVSTGNSSHDPDFAYSSPLFSSGEHYLSSGTYSIDVHVRESPYGSGGAFIRADFGSDPNASVTPEPVTMALLGTGLAGLGAMRRRQRNQREETDA